MPWPGQIGSQFAHALDVVPHPVRVDDPAAGALGDPQHPAVDVGGHPGDHLASAALPSRAGQFARTRSWLRADAAGGDDHRLGRGGRSRRRPSREVGAPRATSAGSSISPRTPVDGAARAVTSSSTRCRNRSGHLTVPDGSRTRRTNGSSTPGPVPQMMWNRGTELPCPPAAYAAALGPAHDREEPTPRALEPGPLLAGGELDVGPGPSPGPVVLGRSNPAVPSQSCQASSTAVPDAHAALLGRVDEEQPAEGPERLPAEAGRRLLVTAGPGDRRRPARPSRPARPGPPRRR